MCNDKVWMTWLAAIISGAIFEESYPGPSTVGYSYMLIGDALVNNGGEDPIMDQEGPHLMMLFPKSVDISHLPQSPNAGGPYVMWANTPLVHVMVPITDRDR